MRIEQPHTLGQQEAIVRVDRFLDGLIENPPGGATIKDPRKTWNANRLTFAFAITRGFFGTSFSGWIDVTEDRVVLEAELPSLVKTFLGEQRVRQVIAEHLGNVLK